MENVGSFAATKSVKHRQIRIVAQYVLGPVLASKYWLRFGYPRHTRVKLIGKPYITYWTGYGKSRIFLRGKNTLFILSLGICVQVCTVYVP